MQRNLETLLLKSDAVNPHFVVMDDADVFDLVGPRWKKVNQTTRRSKKDAVPGYSTPPGRRESALLQDKEAMMYHPP
jgi:hypothetical protein